MSLLELSKCVVIQIHEYCSGAAENSSDIWLSYSIKNLCHSLCFRLTVLLLSSRLFFCLEMELHTLLSRKYLLKSINLQYLFPHTTWRAAHRVIQKWGDIIYCI